MPRRLLWIALLALAFAAPAAAATVHVKVVDENGAPVGRARVFLQQGGKENALGNPFRRSRLAETSAGGHVQFDGLQPGHYVLGTRTVDSLLGKDEDNPLAPRAQVTIDTPDQVLQVQLELQRGTQLCTRFVIDGSRLDAVGSVSRKELESGYSTKNGLRREEDLCELLFAGRWDVRLEPPGGYVLVDLDINGSSSGESTALLDVRSGSPTQHVTWYLVALARLEGKVYFEGERFGVLIRAELLQPGDWLTQAEARGGSLYAPVQVRPDHQTDDYAVDLPDGRWRIQAVGDGLEQADPAMVEVDISKGEQYRQDFTVRGESSGYQLGLKVTVKSPNGTRVADAVVELWPAGPEQRRETPLASERTQRWGSARIRNLEPGEYRVVAGHRGFREGVITVEFDPDDVDSRSRTIRLDRAAELNVRLVPDEEHDIAGGVIELTRDDEPLATELADEKLLNELRHPRAEFDATDRAWVSGIYAGSYRVTGSHDRLLFEFKQDGRWVEQPEIEFADGQSRELEARVVPAATVAGQLYCVGGEPLPGNADLRIVPAGARPGDPLDREWQKETVLERNSLLGGEHHDAFDVGPLPPADYLVAVQPATFDRWTWAYGTENGAEAQSFQAKRGETIALGAIAVDCAPALHVTLTVGSGRDAPDLSGTRWERDLQLQATIVTQDGQRHQLQRADLERYERLLILRGFQEGEVNGEISLCHDHFVPGPWIRVPFSGSLSRGGTLPVVVPIADVGGAIELKVASRAVVAAGLVDAQGIERIAPLEDGSVSIPNLPVGAYELQLCAEPDCATLLGEPETIEIEPHRTLELRRSISKPDDVTVSREPIGQGSLRCGGL